MESDESIFMPQATFLCGLFATCREMADENSSIQRYLHVLN